MGVYPGTSILSGDVLYCTGGAAVPARGSAKVTRGLELHRILDSFWRWRLG